MNDQTPIAWIDLSPEAKGAAIRPLIIEHLMSYSQIAKKLGTTRSAIAAAADRHRIISPLTRGHTGEIGSKGGTAYKARTPRNPKVKPPRPKSRIAPTEPAGFPTDMVDRTPLTAGAWTALPGTTPRPLDQREHDQCAWPLGDGHPFLFCCAPVVLGKVYCAAHNKLAFRPREDRKKVIA